MKLIKVSPEHEVSLPYTVNDLKVKDVIETATTVNGLVTKGAPQSAPRALQLPFPIGEGEL